MRIILISATGLGAGKTTLAHRFTDTVISLADEIRRELTIEIPTINFFGKDQKDKLRIVDDKGTTVRDLLIMRGQRRRKEDENHWADLAVARVVEIYNHHSAATVAVDDIRYLNELNRFRETFTGFVTHIHICEGTAVQEPQYQNDLLEQAADYVIRRG